MRVPKRAAGPEPGSLTGSASRAPVAPGTSASLARAGAAMGARGPARGLGGGGAGPAKARGAAAVAVTSREGVGTARSPPDYKRTRPAAAGVARRCVSGTSLRLPARFFLLLCSRERRGNGRKTGASRRGTARRCRLPVRCNPATASADLPSATALPSSSLTA